MRDGSPPAAPTPPVPGASAWSLWDSETRRMACGMEARGGFEGGGGSGLMNAGRRLRRRGRSAAIAFITPTLRAARRLPASVAAVAGPLALAAAGGLGLLCFSPAKARKNLERTSAPSSAAAKPASRLREWRLSVQHGRSEAPRKTGTKSSSRRWRPTSRRGPRDPRVRLGTREERAGAP